MDCEGETTSQAKVHDEKVANGKDNVKESKPSPAYQTGSKGTDFEDALCPLFMDGLPSDFATNPHLAAIASLLEDDEEDKEGKKKKKQFEFEEDNSVCFAGGGKAKKNKTHSNRSKPYSSVKKKSKATIGEAQLFMKMWKL